MEWAKYIFRFNFYRFTYFVIFYVCTINGTIPQILRDESGRIKIIQTIIQLIIPLFKLSFTLWNTRYALPHAWKWSGYVTIGRRAFNAIYMSAGVALHTMNLLRSTKMQKILTYQKSLIPEGDVKPSWNFLLFWVVLAAGTWKTVHQYLYFKAFTEGTTFKIIYTNYHTVRYLDMSLSMIFIGSSFFLYESGCNKVLKYMREGLYHEAMEMYLELAQNFQYFVTAYSYELINAAFFHTCWLIQKMGSDITQQMFFPDLISPSKLATRYFFLMVLPDKATIALRFIYVCVAASALKVQRDNILNEVLNLKMKQFFNENKKRNHEDDPIYSQADVWIRIINLYDFSVTGAGLFTIDAGFISTIIEITCTYIMVMYSSYLSTTMTSNAYNDNDI